MEYMWLTDLSRKFLENDYIPTGQTVENRIDIICENAESILGISGFASRFRDNMKKGWYSLSSPIWSNFGTERALPISCVVGDTWINTKIDGGKQAKDIQIGDEVLTHKGRYREVTNIIKTEDKSDIYCLKISSRMTNLYLTGNHLVLTNLGWVKTEELDPKLHLVAINREDGLSYAPIRLIQKTDKKETVYDFTVEEDHSFSAAGVILHNCYGSTISDSMESILYTLAEVGMMTKIGGGTSAYFGNLRPRGSKISSGGESSGSVHFTKLFDNIINIVSQGQVRRGSFAAYLPIDHPDIDEFLQIKSDGNPIQHISFGVCVPDSFMEEMIAGDLAKRKLWAKVIECRINTGYPYIFFTDNVNKGTLDVYKDKGLKITHSNLCCVIGNERVVSNRGLLTAKELYEQGGDLILFDGEKSVQSSEMKLISELEDVYRITLNNGMSHTITKCHKVQTDQGMKRLDELKIDEKIAVQINKGIFGFRNMEDEAFLLGLYQADGTQYKDLEERFSFEKGYVPQWIWESDENTQWQYIRGLYNKGNPLYLSLSSINKKFLLEIQILLLNLGIRTSINLMRPDGNCYRLVSSSKFLDRDNRIKSIEYIGKQPVYCCEVYSEEHKWICNGVVTHNSEIMLPDNEHESFVCDLASLNILHYDEWKNTDAVELLVYFLDAVMTEFIHKAEKIPFMERAVKFARHHRAIGIGWLGWHSYLQSKMISFESLLAKAINIEVAKNIQKSAYNASVKLANEYGEPELLKGYGRRNAVLCAIAPTKSSSFILGQVSEGIQPDTTNYCIKDLQKGKFTIKNKYLQNLLSDRGKDTDEVWLSILQKGGSVQHLTFLSTEEKDVFKTFGEISPREIIIQAAARQKYIDQGQSLNLMIHPSTPVKDINSLLIEAWQLGIKSLYYQIGVSASQEFSRNILNCKNCES